MEDEPETTGGPAMPRPPRAAAPGILFAGSTEQPDGFELIGESIAGGEGVVWRALDHRLRTPGLCAVKILAAPAEADRRLLDDNVRLLRHLSPAHVVRVHEVLYGPPPHRRGRADAAAPEAVYLIMEWVDGPTLRQLAAGRRATAATLMERLKYVAQLAGALADLTPMNANAATHRDIKPGNCIVSERRGLVLIDVTTLRHAGGFDQDGLHTPQYAAPEVRKAPRRPRSIASEMYSLGAVAAFCLTGSDPAAASSPTEVARWTADLLRAAAEAGVDDPEAFIRHLRRAMAEDPRERPDDPVAWSQTLIELALRRPGDRPPPALPRPVRRWPIWTAAAVIAAAGTGLVTAARLPDRGPSAAVTVNAGSAPTLLSAAPQPSTSVGASRPTPAPGHDSPTHTATRTSTGPTVKPTTTAKTGTVVTARGTIAPVGPPAEVKSCAYFSGSAELPPDTTLILTKRNLSNDNPAVYAEVVSGWSDPATLTSWQGAQYFGSGDESTGQNYEVGLRAVPLAAAREFYDSGEKDYGQAIAKLGTQLDAVQVLRVAGEGPNGCPGPSA